MNKDFVLFHLNEAHDALDQTIKDLESDPEYGEGGFLVDMAHLYHHVNSAWNARDSTPEQSRICSREDFNKWSRYPDDLEVMQQE